MSNVGGSFAFFATFRPRGGITDEVINRLIAYMPIICRYWTIVEEKVGEERHVHVCLFLHKAQQRSNIVTMLTRRIIYDWDDDEKKNFRRWCRNLGTGAVKVLTNLEVITSYLSGEYARKSEDYFAIVDRKLPEDLSELESFVPQVGALLRPKNMKNVTLLRQLQEHLNWPSREKAGDPYYWYLGYTWHCLCWLEVNDIRECQIDVRVARMFCYSFHCWFLRQSRNANFMWSTTTEARSGTLTYSPQWVIDHPHMTPPKNCGPIPDPIPKEVDYHHYRNNVGE